jgi:site-specific recombinase XerD
VAKACATVDGYKDLYHRFEKRMTTSGRSPSTLQNYSRYISQIALHFNCLPTLLHDDQIEDYLHQLLRNSTPSESYFKHTVYGLRFLFRLEGLKDKRIALPSIQKEKKLPTVLSRQEIKAMIKCATLLKHRLMVSLLYGCGLRCGEVRTIELRDIDLHRQMLLVRQSKGRKDRYVPLGQLLVRGIQSYLDAENPQQYLFNGNPHHTETDQTCFSQKGVQWIIKMLSKKAGITKDVNVHTLRHSYATHLLEDGMDIVSVKELLGHAHIETTMVYLHVAQSGRQKPFSPFDRLYQIHPTPVSKP